MSAFDGQQSEENVSHGVQLTHTLSTFNLRPSTVEGFPLSAEVGAKQVGNAKRQEEEVGGQKEVALE
jgi:hypothetical protein